MTSSWWWWRVPLERFVRGRQVILAGAVAAGWTGSVRALRDVGAADVLVVATEGAGAGPQPDARSVIVDVPSGVGGTMARVRAGLRLLADPPADVVAAVEEFDPERRAVVFGHFLNETSTLVGRPIVAYRRVEWVALEDKTVVDALLDRAGIARAESRVLAVGDAASRWRMLDRGHGTVWAADSRDGYHGGGSLTRWVADAAEADAVTAELARHCDRVRIMPFLDGIATSIHGIVLPDGVAALRPVELVTLRRGRELRYCGCATFWDPPDAVRDEMRAAAQRLGEQLRDEVGFRGAFTLDGVATSAGFRPTELNPRFGAGLGVITRGLSGLPLNLVLDVVVADIDVGMTCADLEREILTAADASRSGGTWQLHVDTPIEVTGRAARYRNGEWAWASEDEISDADVDAGGGFARARFVAERTPVGRTVGDRCAAFWRFADAELGTGGGALEAPGDVTER